MPVMKPDKGSVFVVCSCMSYASFDEGFDIYLPSFS